jgi:phage gp36-like protein
MYSTVDEIREIFVENNIGNEAVITDAEIIRIITDVDAEIDAALYRRYKTPFPDTPQLIQTISKLKSTARAMRDVMRGSNSALIKPEVMEYYEKKGEALLEDLRTGRLEIAGSRRLQMAATTH